MKGSYLTRGEIINGFRLKTDNINSGKLKL